MGLNINGVEPETIKYNSTSVDKVLFNGVEVWAGVKRYTPQLIARLPEAATTTDFINLEETTTEIKAIISQNNITNNKPPYDVFTINKSTGTVTKSTIAGIAETIYGGTAINTPETAIIGAPENLTTDGIFYNLHTLNEITGLTNPLKGSNIFGANVIKNNSGLTNKLAEFRLQSGSESETIYEIDTTTGIMTQIFNGNLPRPTGPGYSTPFGIYEYNGMYYFITCSSSLNPVYTQIYVLKLDTVNNTFTVDFNSKVFDISLTQRKYVEMKNGKIYVLCQPATSNYTIDRGFIIDIPNKKINNIEVTIDSNYAALTTGVWQKTNIMQNGYFVMRDTSNNDERCLFKLS